MPIKTIRFEGEDYPEFQTVGFASKFAFPFAQQVCHGTGYDIGCNRTEWALPGAIQIDRELPDEWDAFNLPDGQVDYIFSSHCLEHIPDWVSALDYWTTKIKDGGVLFLYLPHYNQKYWRPWNNRKHVSALMPWMIKDYLQSRGFVKIFVGGPDLYHSFMVMAEKGTAAHRMGMTEGELEFMKKTVGNGRKMERNSVWEKAFGVYNQQHQERQLQTSCAPCYGKVLAWHLRRN